MQFLESVFLVRLQFQFVVSSSAFRFTFRKRKNMKNIVYDFSFLLFSTLVVLVCCKNLNFCWARWGSSKWNFAERQRWDGIGWILLNVWRKWGNIVILCSATCWWKRKPHLTLSKAFLWKFWTNFEYSRKNLEKISKTSIQTWKFKVDTKLQLQKPARCHFSSSNIKTVTKSVS